MPEQKLYRVPVNVTSAEWREITHEADSLHLSMGAYLVLCHNAYRKQLRQVLDA